MQQQHTLHESSDEDWGVANCWSVDRIGQIVPTPHELSFEELLFHRAPT